MPPPNLKPDFEEQARAFVDEILGDLPGQTAASDSGATPAEAPSRPDRRAAVEAYGGPALETRSRTASGSSAASPCSTNELLSVAAPIIRRPAR